jgi:ketosteroid isomerase-like protein
LAGALALCLQSAGQARATGDEQALWKLERAYWSYVQDNDLKGYLSLWHQDFLGWPSVHAAPVHKDHITDWITAQTSKGLRLEAAEFKPAAIQVTGDVAVTCYRITFKWADRDGNGTTHTLRILHTFVREGKDWQIMGGMSMPEGPVAP